MKLNRGQLRSLINEVLNESKYDGRKPIKLSKADVKKHCETVKCPKDKIASAIGYKGFNAKGNKLVDCENAIRKELGCENEPSKCTIEQVGPHMIFIGWLK